MSAIRQIPYRFVLPDIRKTPFGSDGVIAEYIPYRLGEDLCADAIAEELRRVPHMKQLSGLLSPERRLYLLHGDNLEALQLAASYIGSYHRLCTEEKDLDEAGYYDMFEEEGEDYCTYGFRRFDFGTCLPYLNKEEITNFYCPGCGHGYGSFFGYRESSVNKSLPWWLLNRKAPVCVLVSQNITDLAETVSQMSERGIIILLCTEQEDEDYDAEDSDCSFDEQIANLAFALETECIEIETADAESPYKRKIFRQLCEKQGASLRSAAQTEKILALIAESRKNVDNQTLSRAVSNALLRRDGKKGPLTERDFSYLTALSALSAANAAVDAEKNLVGQQAVREQLESIVRCMAFQKKRASLGLPADSIHYTFAFMGAPGTGKTTWAQYLASKMAERRLLTNTRSICINAAELKAKYVGHTSARVKSIFDTNGVIILDEAYALAGGEDDDNFGREALAQLCVELEEHACDRLVIFAGYGGSERDGDNPMLRFMQSNPGISSRISFKIQFDDFAPDELVTVYHRMLESGGYSVPASADAAVEAHFAARRGQRGFGNCREARNLADRTKIVLSTRLSQSSKITKTQASTVIEQDILTALGEVQREYDGLAAARRSIGFC